jgi:hypothetical protein
MAPRFTSGKIAGNPTSRWMPNTSALAVLSAVSGCSSIRMALSLSIALSGKGSLSCLTPKRRRDRHPAIRRGCVRKDVG